MIWNIAEDHIPTIDEALEKLAHLAEHGPSQDIYGWENLPSAKLWKEQRCA